MAQAKARFVTVMADNTYAKIRVIRGLLQKGHYCDAHELALEVASRPAFSPDIVVEMAQLLRKFEESERLIRLVAQADWQRCTSGRLITEAARLTSASG